jgi:predicted NUDIX family phosphoesterase
MDKNDQQILVITKNKLFDGDEFQGVASKGDYEKRILEHGTYMRRGDAENNPEYKQPVSYGLIINPTTKQVFLYQRANTDEHAEMRLASNWAVGVGGHVEKVDDDLNPLKDSVRREVSEEVTIAGDILDVVPIGYVNDDSNDVGKVHIGILYAIETNALQAASASPEMKTGGFVDITVAQELIKELNTENWTDLVAPLLKRYL